MTARLLMIRMVERKWPGSFSISFSCWAERLPSSARCLMRSLPIDVSAVSAAEANTARIRQIPRTRNCHQVLSASTPPSVLPRHLLSVEQLAYRAVLMDAGDGVGQQGGHG